MLKFFKIHIATMIFMSFSFAFGAADVNGSPKRLLNPTQTLEASWSVPALVAATTAGATASFINWLTLRGNVVTMHKDVSTPLNLDDIYKTAEPKSEPVFNHEALKKAVKAESERCAAHRNFSFVRRTTLFKAVVFLVPGCIAYRTVNKDEALKQVVCERAYDAQKYLQGLRK